MLFSICNIIIQVKLIKLHYKLFIYCKRKLLKQKTNTFYYDCDSLAFDITTKKL